MKDADAFYQRLSSRMGAPVSGGRFPDREGTETAGSSESGN